MVQAGLCHVEVGLQSINPVALRTVGRRFDEERFISGLRLLRDAGVKVMTDVMVGLPGDRLADVKRAIDFVLDQDLCDELGVYPLSVLPGTVLRAQARRFGIEYLPEPPYLITKSSTMNRDDIREAFAYAKRHREPTSSLWSCRGWGITSGKGNRVSSAVSCSAVPADAGPWIRTPWGRPCALRSATRRGCRITTWQAVFEVFWL
jgi:hypothetical protein